MMKEKEIIKEIKKWQNLLGLQDWIFLVQLIDNSVVSDHGDVARCLIREEAMAADIMIAIGLPDKEIRSSIKHELLHVVLHELSSVFDDAVSLLGVEASTALNNRFFKNEEKLVIKLERLIDQFSAEDAEEEARV